MDNPVLNYKKRFAIRTIKDGRVKIHGRYYYPNDAYMEYDGRLDGMRYAFGLYHIFTGEGYEIMPYAHLWGTEERYNAVSDGDEEKSTFLYNNAPELVNGGYPWQFWKTKEYQK